MSWLRNTLLAGVLCLSHVATVPAAMVTSGSPATTVLSGQLVVSGSLDGNVGRPDTFLQEFDPAYQHVLASDDNSSTIGNGLASELTAPLRTNGSAYFRVFGPSDSSAPFNWGPNNWGLYTYQFTVYDVHHNLIQTLPPQMENVWPGMVNNIWLDPSSDPRRGGGTVTVTLNNVVGAGAGDSRNYYSFTGLQAGQPFTARIDAASFPGLIGLFDSNYNLTATSIPGSTTVTVAGHADPLGRVLIGVTGADDTQFTGQHAESGTYTIEVIPTAVPEPSSVVLLGLGGALASLYWQSRRGR
jgi:hypothetical protein